MEFRILEWLWERFRSDNEGRVLVEIPAKNVVGGPPPGDTLRGDGGYFRLWVTRLSLARDRDWFTARYPSVSSFATFNFGGRPSPIVIANVAGPEHLKKVDKSHLDTVVSIDHIISPMAPFRGGSVGVEVGLLSVEARDDMARFLSAMGTVASLVAVPQLSAALTVAEKVAAGAKELAGVKGNRMVLGYQATFVGEDDKPGDPAGNELRDRYMAVINAPGDSGKYSKERLWIKDGNVHVGDDSGSAAPLTGVDWMVLRIETRAQRDDYSSLHDIMVPLRKAIEALGGDNVAADALADQARRAAWTSDDLIDADRPRVAALVVSKYKQAKGQRGRTLASDVEITAEDVAGVSDDDVAAITPDGPSLIAG